MTVKRCMAQHNQACYLSFSHVWLRSCRILVSLPMSHCPRTDSLLSGIHVYHHFDFVMIPLKNFSTCIHSTNSATGLICHKWLRTLESLRLFEHVVVWGHHLKGVWGGGGEQGEGSMLTRHLAILLQHTVQVTTSLAFLFWNAAIP